MAHGSKTFVFTFNSAAAVANEVANVAGYQFASLQIQTITTESSIRLEGGDTATTSQLRPVYAMGVYSAGSGILQWEVPDSLGNLTTPDVPIWGQEYVRPVLNTASTDGITDCTIYCYNQ